MTIDDEHTTIQISKEIQHSLQGIGKKGQTYNDIIKNLIDIWKVDDE